MAKVLVGVGALELPVAPGQTPVIQNLGPGVLYLDSRPGVTTGTGLRVPVDSAYEWPKDVDRGVWAVADQANTDVRVVVVG